MLFSALGPMDAMYGARTEERQTAFDGKPMIDVITISTPTPILQRRAPRDQLAIRQDIHLDIQDIQVDRRQRLI
jgi:hypothetical protein